jgi:hypothetical protein
MQSKATSVQAYLKELPEDRRAAVEAVRKVVNDAIDADIEEGMQYGMICWYVPHRVFPAGYHVDPRIPLPYAALASQKHYLSLYLSTTYGEGGDGERWFRSEWAKTGRKLDMGKSCIRFKRFEDLASEVVAAALRRVDSKTHIRNYTATLAGLASRKAAGKATRKAAAKSAKAPARKAGKAVKPVAKKR